MLYICVKNCICHEPLAMCLLHFTLQLHVITTKTKSQGGGLSVVLKQLPSHLLAAEDWARHP